MSRLEELREQFRRKVASYDREKMAFTSALFDFVTDRFDATSHDDAFEERLYAAYKADAPADVTQWLVKRLEGKFQAVAARPVWIDEASWSFHEGEPLTFVGQIQGEDGEAFYLFQGLRRTKEGYETPLYKLLAQHRGGSSVLTGVITYDI
jgi:hypothetical protein